MAEDYLNGQLLLGDPDEFAQEMIKLINDKEFRLACVNVKSRVLVVVYMFVKPKILHLLP